MEAPPPDPACESQATLVRPGEEAGRVRPSRVLVAAPIDFNAPITADFIEEWADAARREVEAGGDTPLFALCGAIEPGASRPRLETEHPAGVAVLVLERSVDPARAAAAGQILERVRLTREAAEAKADVVWFLDLDVRPPAGAWASLRGELAAGAGGALIPYPLSVFGGDPGVVIIGKTGLGNQVLALVDARGCRPEPGRASYPVIGGGMGCVAVPIYTFLVVKFAVAAMDAITVTTGPTAAGEARRAEKTVVSGEALGWYMNAARNQVPIRALAGALCSVVAP